MTRNRRRWTRSLTVMVVVGLAAGGAAWWWDLRYKEAMEEIEADIMNRRYVIACRKLEKLLSWRTDWNGGITYLLGSCELARGRTKAAAAAWARVTPGVAFSERSIRGRMRLFHDDGQFASAEQLIADAALDPRNERTALRALLVPMFRELGRIDEAQRLIEDRWDFLNSRGEGALEPAIKLVLEHVDLTLNAIPIDKLRTELERTAKAGETTTVAEFHRRLAEAEKRLARYRHLFERKQPIRHAQEMAQLAAELGRQFEARAFRTIAASNKMRVSISAQR